MKTTSQRRYRVELITAESEASRFVRHRRLIRFPQLTMPLLAAHTPDHWQVRHTDEIAQRVEQIAQGSELNSASAAKTAAAAQQMEGLAQKLYTLSTRFKIA